MKYSNSLIQRVIGYFQREYNLEINKNKAEQYLDSMAEFFACVSKISK